MRIFELPSQFPDEYIRVFVQLYRSVSAFAFASASTSVYACKSIRILSFAGLTPEMLKDGQQTTRCKWGQLQRPLFP